MYDALMRNIGAPPAAATRLEAQIIDWIDADARPEPGGAEDETYQRFDPPYRAANQRFAEREELLALPEMTPDFYAALTPWLCVRPSGAQPALNINTLGLDQAPLLSAAFAGRLSVPDAEAVLFRRPPRGYDALEDFWADPLIARMEIEGPDREAIAVTSRWFDMSVEVETGDARFELSQLVELTDGGALTRHRQRFGAAS
jgi:general secretion pathway protein K